MRSRRSSGNQLEVPQPFQYREVARERRLLQGLRGSEIGDRVVDLGNRARRTALVFPYLASDAHRRQTRATSGNLVVSCLRHLPKSRS